MFNRFINNFAKSYLKYILVVAVVLMFPTFARAASLSVTPSSVNVSAGNIFSLNINIDTSGNYINNAEGTIQFPSDLLEVVSVSKSSSIFTLWVEEPTFSNNTGVVTFNGGVANPGYSGAGGKIGSITFKAKKQGVATVMFSDGAIRKNDGLGTNIISEKRSSSITIVGTEEVKIEQPIDTGSGLPEKPVVSSGTHPDQGTWYAQNLATFSWKVPAGVISIQTLFNKSSNSIPSVYYDNSVSQKTFSNIGDGTYYFHIRYQNANGYGPTTHFAILNDSTPPEIAGVTYRQLGTKGLAKLNATDSVSGLSRYTYNIDNGEDISVGINKNIDKELEVPVLAEGGHFMVLNVFDKAGNKASTSLTFASPKITAPKIFINKTDIISGDTISISGTSDYPGYSVQVSLLQNNKVVYNYIQTISPNGEFNVLTDKIKKVGTFEIVAKNIFNEKLFSQPSEKIFLNVSEKGALKVTITLTWIIIISILLIILMLVFYIGWHKYFGLKRSIEKDIEEANKKLYSTSMDFKKQLDSQVEHLNEIKKSRVLTPQEEQSLLSIKTKITDIEAFLDSKTKK